MKLPARLLLSLFFVCISFVASGTTQTFAQTTGYTTSERSHIDTSQVQQNSYTDTQIKLIEVSAALICQLTGVDIINPQQGCLGIDPTTQQIGYAPPSGNVQLGGLLGFSTDAIGALYQPVASTTSYTSYLANNFGIVKSTLAQEEEDGTGFTVLDPVRNLWVTLRDITFVLIVIIFVLIGMGIMLRVKIDPRTVMSIQNQIPKVIIGIILITFSYSIAGLMIDVMWVGTYFSINTITQDVACPQGSGDLDTQLPGAATRNLLNNPIAYTTDIFGDETGCLGTMDGIIGIAGAVGMTLGDILSRTILEAIGLDASLDSCDTGWLGLGIPFDFTDCVEQGFFGAIKYVVGILAILILIFAIVFALFKLWFTLIRAFVYVLIGVITAPLWIAAGLLPGATSLTFGTWFRFMAANLMAFPAAVAMILLARVMYVSPGINNPTPEGTFIPPLIGNPNMADNLGNLIAVGIIFITPEVLNFIRDALKSQPNSRASQAVYGGFRSGVGAGLAMPRAIMSRQLYFDKQTKEAGGLRYLGQKAVGRIPGFSPNRSGQPGRMKQIFGVYNRDNPNQ